MLNMEGKTDLQREIEGAIKDAGIEQFDIGNKSDVVSRIIKIYVKGKPRVWWLALNHVKSIHGFENNMGFAAIPKIIENIDGKRHKNREKVYLVADENEDGESLWVYKIQLDKLSSIIENCRYFEYYVVAIDYSWLIAENDHGDVIVCQAPLSCLSP